MHKLMSETTLFQCFFISFYGHVIILVDLQVDQREFSILNLRSCNCREAAKKEDDSILINLTMVWLRIIRAKVWASTNLI